MPSFCPKDFAELSAFARAKLKRTQRRKLLIAAFWKQAGLPFLRRQLAAEGNRAR
jgi:hypothetical protein